MREHDPPACEHQMQHRLPFLPIDRTALLAGAVQREVARPAARLARISRALDGAVRGVDSGREVGDVVPAVALQLV
jgi:hypothetical protein